MNDLVVIVRNKKTGQEIQWSDSTLAGVTRVFFKSTDEQGWTAFREQLNGEIKLEEDLNDFESAYDSLIGRCHCDDHRLELTAIVRLMAQLLKEDP